MPKHFRLLSSRRGPGQNTAGCVPGDRKLYDFISDRSPAFIGPMSEVGENLCSPRTQLAAHFSFNCLHHLLINTRIRRRTTKFFAFFGLLFGHYKNVQINLCGACFFGVWQRDLCFYDFWHVPPRGTACVLIRTRKLDWGGRGHSITSDQLLTQKYLYEIKLMASRWCFINLYSFAPLSLGGWGFSK